jgi:hypothetical protein
VNLSDAVNIVDLTITYLGEEVLPEYRARAIEVLWNSKDHYSSAIVSEVSSVLEEGTVRFLCDDPHDEYKYYLASMN